MASNVLIIHTPKKTIFVDPENLKPHKNVHSELFQIIQCKFWDWYDWASQHNADYKAMYDADCEEAIFSKWAAIRSAIDALVNQMQENNTFRMTIEEFNNFDFDSVFE